MKQVEKARNEIAKWEAKAVELEGQITDQEQQLEDLRSGLGEVVISGGDVDKVTGEIGKAERKLEAFRSGYTAAILRIEAGREALVKLEQEQAEDRIKDLQAQGEKDLAEVVQLLEALEIKSQGIMNLAYEGQGLRSRHALRAGFAFDPNYWRNQAQKFKGFADDLKRIGPSISNFW